MIHFPEIPEIPTKESRRKVYGRYLMAAILIIMSFIGMEKIVTYYNHRLIPPIVASKAPYLYVNDPDVVATSVKAGSHIVIRTFTNRIVVCNVESQYSIMQFSEKDGILIRKVLYSWPIAKNRSLVGDTITDKFLSIPDWIPDGDYVIVRQSDYTCEAQKLSSDGSPLPIHISR